MATCAVCHGAHEVLPKVESRSKVSSRTALADLPGLPPERQRQLRRVRAARQQAQTRNAADPATTPRSSCNCCWPACSRSSACTPSCGLPRGCARWPRARPHGRPARRRDATDGEHGPARRRRSRGRKAPRGRYYRRFDRVDRVMHAFLMITFIGCALVGTAAALFGPRLGGPPRAHARRLRGRGADPPHLRGRDDRRVRSHVARLFRTPLGPAGLLTIAMGPDSMVPQPQDVIDIYRHVLWFVGQGPEPAVRPLDLWEKFDYWAVFWGMAIIGGSGLVLWFPPFFSQFLPGWSSTSPRGPRRGSAARGRLHLHHPLLQRAHPLRRSSRWTPSSSPAASASTS